VATCAETSLARCEVLTDDSKVVTGIWAIALLALRVKETRCWYRVFVGLQKGAHASGPTIIHCRITAVSMLVTQALNGISMRR
jgi:hypothetical protein